MNTEEAKAIAEIIAESLARNLAILLQEKMTLEEFVTAVSQMHVATANNLGCALSARSEAA
jgi:hypothetical protein